MSELAFIDVCSSAKRELLGSVSALALSIILTSSAVAEAKDVEHPTVWIELGGQLETMQGASSPLSAPFMFPDIVPDVYGVKSFAERQKAPRFAFGGEGKVTFQPQGSDWSFSAAARFGRSNSNKHTHYQGPQAAYILSGYALPKYAAAFSDVSDPYRESHTVLDFSVGRDVGIGAFGPNGNSTLNLGVRAAEYSIKSSTSIYARPAINFIGINITFYQYALNGSASRNFHGIGPSLSWNASTTLLGSAEGGEVTLDWGINGSVLFGRQNADVQHATSAYQFDGRRPRRQGQNVLLYDHSYETARSHSVTVPNLGGFAGISMRKANAKVSLGYRADFFFGAMDTGIDARRTSDLGFHGPFATISIGLGG